MITAARFDASSGSWNSPVSLSIPSLIALSPIFASGLEISSYHQSTAEWIIDVQGTWRNVHKTLTPAFACSFSGFPMASRESVEIVSSTMMMVSSASSDRIGGIKRRKARKVSKAISSVKESVG